MPIQKGQILPGAGRPKNSQNRTTSEIRAAFQQLVSNNIDTLQSDLESMEPEKRVSYIIKLSEFILPKLQSLSIDNQFEIEYKHLEALLSKAPEQAIEAITAKLLTIKQIEQ
jgi:hypothetical protein